MKLIPLSLSLLLLAPHLFAAGPMIPGLGSVTDPVGDCKIIGDASRLTIAIPAGDHALAAERKSMTAPRVLQEVTGNFTAQVTITVDFPQNTSTKVPGRFPFQGAGLLLWADPETYVRLERAQARVTWQGEQQHFIYPAWELRFATKPLRLAIPGDGTLTTATTTFRLTRTGSKLTAALSEDGTTWRELDPLTIKLPEKVQIGVVASHNTDGSIEATFEHFTLTPLPTKN